MHANYLQLGPLHIPVFGVMAALGLVAGLGLSQKTARYVGLEAGAVWDVGMVGVVAAFCISRVLLVVFNLHSFLMYPVLVMAVPSLTGTGLVVTAVVVGFSLRRRRIPVLAWLDAMAPSAALLWAFLSLGRVLDGTRDGMPASVVWGVGVPGTASYVQPVEFYTMLVAAGICLGLLGVVMRRGVIGRTAGWGLVLGGVAAFFLDFLRVPAALYVDESGLERWGDLAQFLGVGMMVVGSLLLARKSARAVVFEEERDSMGAGHAV